VGKTKYRGLSTAAAKCAAFGRDDVGFWGGWEERATTTVAPYEMTNKKDSNDNSRSLRDDKQKGRTKRENKGLAEG
jgi:hypothetical protein